MVWRIRLGWTLLKNSETSSNSRSKMFWSVMGFLSLAFSLFLMFCVLQVLYSCESITCALYNTDSVELCTNWEDFWLISGKSKQNIFTFRLNCFSLNLNIINNSLKWSWVNDVTCRKQRYLSRNLFSFVMKNIGSTKHF